MENKENMNQIALMYPYFHQQILIRIQQTIIIKGKGTWALTGPKIFVHGPKLENQLSRFVALMAPTVMTVLIRAGE
jgi:hypothetical protein